jgi:hypothetical protein
LLLSGTQSKLSHHVHDIRRPVLLPVVATEPNASEKIEAKPILVNQPIQHRIGWFIASVKAAQEDVFEKVHLYGN